MLSVRGTICNSFSHDIIFSFETKKNLYELELKHKKYVLGIAQRAGTQEENCFHKKKNICFIIGAFVSAMLEDHLYFGSCKNSVVTMVHEKRKRSLEPLAQQMGIIFLYYWVGRLR